MHVTYRIYSKKWMVICMAAKQDYYELLGVAKNADATAIKKAYRKLAKKYHPDTNAGDPAAEQKFKDVTEAYTILSDPEKRKLYDQFGHAAFDGSMPEGGAYQYSGAGAGQNGGSMEDPTVVEEVTVSTVMEMVDFISITATDRVPADSDRMAILETLAAAAVLAEVSSGRKEATFMQMSP